MWITLDSNRAVSLTKQLYDKIKEMIFGGALSAGEKLPSSRALAGELRLSRNTILKVYDQLAAEGYIEGRRGSGTVVKARLERAPAFFRAQSARAPSASRNAEKPPIDFHSGIPDLNHFPLGEWTKLYRRVCGDLPPSALRYGRSAGAPALRDEISKYIRRTRGIDCPPDNVMIVSGSTQGLSLVSRLLYASGGRAVLEDPTHPGLREVVASAGYRLTAVPADDDGLRTDLLDPSLHAAFIYITPSHQYPLGGVMPIQRRISLLQYAAQNDCYLIEDDYDGEFRYEGRPINSLYELNPDKVVYMGSFSKTLAPAIRIGFMLLPNALIAGYEKLKLYSDVHTETLSQYVLAEFIRGGGLEKHIRKMKKIYKGKREHLIGQLNANFPGQFEIKGHAAGLHARVRFDGISFTKELIQKIRANGANVYPVEQYAWKNLGRREHEILLGYAHLSHAEIADGIRLLRIAVESG